MKFFDSVFRYFLLKFLDNVFYFENIESSQKDYGLGSG